MMKKSSALITRMRSMLLPHSPQGGTGCCFCPLASFQFSTIPNPNPKRPNFPYSSNPTHARLEQLLLEKSKVGFDKLDDALVVFDKMLLIKPLPTVIDFNQLLTALVKMKQYSTAVSLFQHMRVLCIPVDIFTFNTVINCCCHLNRLEALLCTIVLHGLCQNHFVVEALSFFQMMECSGLSPDIYIYTILIDGLSKNGHLEKARSLFDNLSSKGLRPNVKTYTMMIQAFCGEGLLDEANKLFVEMEANGCLPDDVTYNTLIRGCFLNKKYTEAGVLIDEMRARRFSADASTASVLLDLLESQEQDPALLVLRKKYVP